MKQHLYFIPTTKEVPSDAESISNQLLIRAGFIKQESAGVFIYLPLAYQVIQKINKIIEEEMMKINVPEMLMPIILPATLWQESGRYESYGPDLYKFEDRNDRDFILGPTHEETFTELIRNNLRSYKDFPKSLYQIQTKFRDEKRPRFGLLRNKEFIMLDGYSFGASQDDLDRSYDQFDEAFENVFKRVELDFISVVADNGAMGGGESKEFQAPADIGEDEVAYTDDGYAANIEVANGLPKFTSNDSDEPILEMVEVATPNSKTVSEVSEFFKVPEEKVVKSILYIIDGKPVLVSLPGDHEVNELKLTKKLDAKELRLAEANEVKDLLGVNIGSIGPVGIKETVELVVDPSIKEMHNFLTGANKDGFHYQNVNYGRDFTADKELDILTVKQGDFDLNSKSSLKVTKSIEIGHIFKLGTYYTEKMKANFVDLNGKDQPIIMGSYGIGVSRLVSAIVEQNNDENGIIWPKSVTPFDVHIIETNTKEDTIINLANNLESNLEKSGYSVLCDDRNIRPGVKFAESDLFGIPLRITVGRKAKDNIVEIKYRKTGEVFEIPTSEVVDFVTKFYS